MRILTPFLLFLLPLAAVAELSRSEMTPAERAIAQARAAIERQAAADTTVYYQPYNDLALGYARRARETADSAYYEKAHEALDRSLEIQPDNYPARRLRVWTLLGQHEFAQALDQARSLSEEAPDDILAYAFLADAEAELGRYDEAAASVQQMLDFQPGNVPALTRGAYLRELRGMLDGAIDFLVKAYDRTAPHEVEDRAWILVHIGRLERFDGRYEEAERTIEQALELFPGYHYAYAELGHTLAAEGRADEALEAFRKRYEAAPHPENLYDLAHALEAAGRGGEASDAYARFEREALAESQGWDNANRELIAYYADVAGRPDEALRLAEHEIERRQDAYTRAAYALALARSGEDAEAREQIRRVIELGVRDPKLLAIADGIR